MGHTNFELLTVAIIGVLMICAVLLPRVWRQRKRNRPDRASTHPERRQLLRRSDDRTIRNSIAQDRRRKIRPASQGGGDASLSARLLESDCESQVRATLGQSYDMFKRGQIGLETFSRVARAEQRAASRKAAEAMQIQPRNESEQALVNRLVQESEAVLEITRKFLELAQSSETPPADSAEFNQ
jgi:FtsZ-interacting cell division protein ZipA